MGFDIKNLVTDSFAAWLEYNNEIDIRIRHVSRQEMADIIKGASRTTFDRDHNRRDVIDNMIYGELLGVAAILDWRGLVSGGEIYPCNEANIKTLMRKWADFAKFVSESCADFERLVQAEEALAKKNSVTTSAHA